MARAASRSVSAYLARLPRGVDSHPEAQVKASVLRDQVEAAPLTPEELAALPEPVQALVAAPPPVSSWIPEVHALTYSIAVRDAHFAPGRAGDAQYERWTYERNRKLLGRPLYRPLFLLTSPTRLLRRVDRRWAAFRRGSTVAVVDETPGEIVLATRYPPYLHDEIVALGMKGALQAAVELAGGRDVRLEVLGVTARETQLRIGFRA